jgi:hypothetical protein
VYEAPKNSPGWGTLDFCTEPKPQDQCLPSSGASSNSSNISSGNASSNDTNLNATLDTNVTATPVLTCYDQQLSTCLNRRVVEVFQAAIDSCHQVPVCKPRYSWSAALTFFMSWVSEDKWSYIKGRAKNYADGTRYDLNLTDVAGFQASLASVQISDNSPAIMFLVLVYSPSLDQMVSFEMLIEDSLSGSLVTLMRHKVIDMHTSYAILRYCLFVVAILFSIGCFLMEIRRITQFPKRFAGLDGNQRERVSMWTLFFLLLPIGIIVDFVIFTMKSLNTADEILTLNGDKLLDENSMLEVHSRMDFEYVQQWLAFAIIITLNILFFRYCLMFFKQMAAVTDMVRRVFKPLFMNLLYIFLVLIVIMVMFYVMYSANFHDFRDPVHTAMVVIRFAQSGIGNWYSLYEYYPVLWIIIMVGSFVLITLFLNNLTLAIMLSHKKEMDLFQNANFHEFWNSARNKKKDASDPKKDFNPAMQGDVFDDDQDYR